MRSREWMGCRRRSRSWCGPNARSNRWYPATRISVAAIALIGVWANKSLPDAFLWYTRACPAPAHSRADGTIEGGTIHVCSRHAISVEVRQEGGRTGYSGEDEGRHNETARLEAVH